MPHKNLCTAELVELSIQRNESKLAENGSILVTTGDRTGRSTGDRFIVDDAENSGNIDWGKVNQKFPEDKFNKLWDKVSAHLASKDYIESEFHVGADDEYYQPLKFKNRICLA